jgi:hypothetical protein
MRHATALLYHVCAVASRNIRCASCGTSEKLTLWTRFVLFQRESLYFWTSCVVRNSEETENKTFTDSGELILYDTVNRNKVSIYIKSLYFLFFTHYMFRPLRAILKWDILFVIFLFLKDYFNTTDPLHACISIIISRDVICRHRFFQPVILIHVIILNIKIKVYYKISKIPRY